jgi:hypothetical protein
MGEALGHFLQGCYYLDPMVLVVLDSVHVLSLLQPSALKGSIILAAPFACPHPAVSPDFEKARQLLNKIVSLKRIPPLEQNQTMNTMFRHKTTSPVATDSAMNDNNINSIYWRNFDCQAYDVSKNYDKRTKNSYIQLFSPKLKPHFSAKF